MGRGGSEGFGWIWRDCIAMDSRLGGCGIWARDLLLDERDYEQ